MIRSTLSHLWQFIVVGALAGTVAHAGEVEVTSQQPFKVGGKDFAAGHYRIIADDENDHTVNIRNLDTKKDIEVPVTTRLSPKEGGDGCVVFDKVGDDYYLTEVYIIGMDGFFFQGAPGKRKHVVVKESLPYPR
jgi:hypothetical protein